MLVHEGEVTVPPFDSLGLVNADTPARIADARELLQEYAASIAGTVCLTHLDEELADLPGAYGPPRGRLLLAYEAGTPIGCVCLRDLGLWTCEMKRLYVRPAHRATGAGRALVESVIDVAAGIGYRRMRLDTLPFMARAIDLYRSLGFVRIDPYGPGAAKGALFFELLLNSVRKLGWAVYTGLARKDGGPRGERYFKELKKGPRRSGTPRNLS